MAGILDEIRTADPVVSSTHPKAGRKAPTIEAVRGAVVDFLKKMPDVKRVHVSKLALMDPGNGIWEAEAEVSVPSEAIRALGLPVRRKVLDFQTYLLRLDEDLNVIAYGLKESLELASTA